MSVPTAAHAFLPWLRRGIATAIARSDDDPTAAPRVELPVTVGFNAGSLTPTAALALAGPGEVIGFDPRAVARTWPRPGVADAETNYFPLLELDQADLPWRYSPVRASAKQRLRPWLCLAVLTETEISAYERATENRPLSVVTVAQGSTLPNLAQSWAWAHAQVTGVTAIDPSATAAILAGEPYRAVARLLCPRRLQTQTAYRAFVVPTFARGRLAGVGEDVPDDLDALAPAWAIGEASIRLPVYYEWAFHTGVAGDFEYLVRLLTARSLPETVGIRNMDLADPGLGLPGAAPHALGLEGALKSPETVSTAWPAAERNPWTAALGTLLNTPEDLLVHGGHDLTVAPPLYGRWYAKRATLDAAAEPPWFQDLNADPRLRVAAGLGTLVVQDQQQQLLASAWQQVEGIIALNEELRRAQLAREAARRIHRRHVTAQDAEATLTTTAPLHGRVPMAGATVRAVLRESPVAEGAFELAWRRISRPLGSIGRRQGRVAAPSQTGAITRMNRGELTAAAPPKLDVTQVATAAQAALEPTVLASRTLAETPSRPDFAAVEAAPVIDLGRPPVRTPDPVGRPDTSAARLFRQEMGMLLRRVVTAPATPPPLRSIDVNAAADEVVIALDPRKTIGDAYRNRLQIAPGVNWQPADPLEPIMAAPEFPQPMSEPLASLSQDWLLPGLDQVPPNTVSLLETNQHFVEAFMVGLNHEISRELLWNEYPTDQRGTYARQFWNSAGHVPSPGENPESLKDIDQIHAWPVTAPLGENSSRPPGPSDEPNLVLLVRGELLRRYPNALVYAAKARRTSGGDEREIDDTVPEKHPIFTGQLLPDVGLFGFELTETVARGNPPSSGGDQGWFFVLQEQPAEPRFGLDLADTPNPDLATRWDQLAWQHLDPTIDYVNLDTDLPDTRNVTDPGGPGAVWHADAGLGAAGSRASDIAYITLQRPVRVAVHATRMLPPR